jgi:serine/threonine-protein kinase HipA
VTNDVLVYVEVDGTDVRAGHLWSHRRRGVESATFRYDASFLTSPRAHRVDPQLPLSLGSQQTDLSVPLFRAFADSSPDRWGRNLILRQERQRAIAAGGPARSLGEFDLMLGVRDDLRLGALRFRADPSGPFLATELRGVPLLTDLPTLLDAADRLERDSAGPSDISLLVRAGSSLGGARPKAHLREVRSGVLAIAKFPSPSSDRWNVMAWEKTALDIAARAGIDVPPARLVDVGGRMVLVVDRFDRRGTTRVGYASALTMLEASDGDLRSYVDIAGVIEESSDAVTPDLAQLWRRMAFSVLISNTDDHLRNHGFLHQSGNVWRLSPAFDLNPDPSPGPRHLATAIDEYDTRASVDTLLSVANLFRLDRAGALAALTEVVGACSGWEERARANGLTRTEIDGMAPAFVHDESVRARQLVSDLGS